MLVLLSIGSLSVEIKRFTDFAYPRLKADPLPSLQYSIAGNSIGEGSLFEAKHVWSIKCLLLPEEAKKLSAIYFEFDLQRRSLQKAYVRVADKSLEFQERSPRTRPLITGEVENDLGNGYISYYAEFNSWFVSAPVFTERGVFVETSFSLQEADKLLAV